MTALVESSGAISWSQTLGEPGEIRINPRHEVRAGRRGREQRCGSTLSTSSGSTKWTFTAGGAVNVSPMIIAGSVYVGSTNGKVYALSEATGDQRWTHSIGSPITASPAFYESLNSQIFVGSSNGALAALASANGDLRSTLHYGSPILGIATVLKAVFITCANGNFDAARNYGQTGEGFSTGTSITTPPVVVDGAVYVGNSSGNFYAVTPYGDAPL